MFCKSFIGITIFNCLTLLVTNGFKSDVRPTSLLDRFVSPDSITYLSSTAITKQNNGRILSKFPSKMKYPLKSFKQVLNEMKPGKTLLKPNRMDNFLVDLRYKRSINQSLETNEDNGRKELINKIDNFSDILRSNKRVTKQSNYNIKKNRSYVYAYTDHYDHGGSLITQKIQKEKDKTDHLYSFKMNNETHEEKSIDSTKGIKKTFSREINLQQTNKNDSIKENLKKNNFRLEETNLKTLNEEIDTTLAEETHNDNISINQKKGESTYNLHNPNNFDTEEDEDNDNDKISIDEEDDNDNNDEEISPLSVDLKRLVNIKEPLIPYGKIMDVMPKKSSYNNSSFSNETKNDNEKKLLNKITNSDINNTKSNNNNNFNNHYNIKMFDDNNENMNIKIDKKESEFVFPDADTLAIPTNQPTIEQMFKIARERNGNYFNLDQTLTSSTAQKPYYYKLSESHIRPISSNIYLQRYPYNFHIPDTYNPLIKTELITPKYPLFERGYSAQYLPPYNLDSMTKPYTHSIYEPVYRPTNHDSYKYTVDKSRYSQYRSTEAIRDLMRAMDSVRHVVFKIKPLRGLASKMYHDIAGKMKEKFKTYVFSRNSFNDINDNEKTVSNEFDPFASQITNAKSKRNSANLKIPIYKAEPQVNGVYVPLKNTLESQELLQMKSNNFMSPIISDILNDGYYQLVGNDQNTNDWKISRMFEEDSKISDGISPHLPDDIINYPYPLEQNKPNEIYNKDKNSYFSKINLFSKFFSRPNTDSSEYFNKTQNELGSFQDSFKRFQEWPQHGYNVITQSEILDEDPLIAKASTHSIASHLFDGHKLNSLNVLTASGEPNVIPLNNMHSKFEILDMSKSSEINDRSDYPTMKTITSKPETNMVTKIFSFLKRPLNKTSWPLISDKRLGKIIQWAQNTTTSLFSPTPSMPNDEEKEELTKEQLSEWIRKVFNPKINDTEKRHFVEHLWGSPNKMEVISKNKSLIHNTNHSSGLSASSTKAFNFFSEIPAASTLLSNSQSPVFLIPFYQPESGEEIKATLPITHTNNSYLESNYTIPFYEYFVKNINSSSDTNLDNSLMSSLDKSNSINGFNNQTLDNKDLLRFKRLSIGSDTQKTILDVVQQTILDNMKRSLEESKKDVARPTENKLKFSMRFGTNKGWRGNRRYSQPLNAKDSWIPKLS